MNRGVSTTRNLERVVPGRYPRELHPAYRGGFGVGLRNGQRATVLDNGTWVSGNPYEEPERVRAWFEGHDAGAAGRQSRSAGE